MKHLDAKDYYKKAREQAFSQEFEGFGKGMTKLLTTNEWLRPMTTPTNDEGVQQLTEEVYVITPEVKMHSIKKQASVLLFF